MLKLKKKPNSKPPKYGNKTIYLPFHTWNVCTLSFCMIFGFVLFFGPVRFEKLWFWSIWLFCFCLFHCFCKAILCFHNFQQFRSRCFFLSFVVLLIQNEFHSSVPLETTVCFSSSFFSSNSGIACDLNCVYTCPIFSLAISFFILFFLLHVYFFFPSFLTTLLVGRSVTFSGSAIHFLIIFTL